MKPRDQDQWVIQPQQLITRLLYLALVELSARFCRPGGVDELLKGQADGLEMVGLFENPGSISRCSGTPDRCSKLCSLPCSVARTYRTRQQSHNFASVELGLRDQLD